MSETRPLSTVLLRENRGSVAILTLNRPEKLNALSNELIAALLRALDSIELDKAIRVIIITGAGRAFSAGADIAAFQEHMRAGPEAAVMHFMRPGHRMTRRVESFPKPIIAAVNGIAFGGGCELIESTHIALAAETSTFSKAEINIGIIPTFGGTQRLPRNIGRKAAIELILSGRTFPSKEAATLAGCGNSLLDGARSDSVRSGSEDRMRGTDEQTGSLFSYQSPESLVPADHPLRVIRSVVNAALDRLSAEFSRALLALWPGLDRAREAAAGAAGAGLLRRPLGTAADGAGALQHAVPLVHRPVDGCGGLGRDGVHQEPRPAA